MLNKARSYWDDILNRNRLFYCTHQNRNNAFFNKHMLNSKELTSDQLADKIFEQAFGFCRIRRSLRDNVMKLLRAFAKNQKEVNYNYYLTKNCQLPDGWKDQVRPKIMHMI